MDHRLVEERCVCVCVCVCVCAPSEKLLTGAALREGGGGETELSVAFKVDSVFMRRHLILSQA